MGRVPLLLLVALLVALLRPSSGAARRRGAARGQRRHRGQKRHRGKGHRGARGPRRRRKTPRKKKIFARRRRGVRGSARRRNATQTSLWSRWRLLHRGENVAMKMMAATWFVVGLVALIHHFRRAQPVANARPRRQQLRVLPH